MKTLSIHEQRKDYFQFVNAEHRTQNDARGDRISEAGALDCSDDPGITRQEQGADADINNIISRFGMDAPQRNIIYGEQDFTFDLQQNISAVKDTRAAYRGLSDDLKKRFPTWQAFVEGLENGNVELAIRDLEKTKNAARAAAAAASVKETQTTEVKGAEPPKSEPKK